MKEYNDGQHKFSICDGVFLKQYRPIINATTPFIEILRCLQYISAIASIPDINFSLVVDACYELVSRLPTSVVEINVPYLLRSRPNYQSNGKNYSTACDLSYNPIVELIKEDGRFNLKKEPVFYASVPCEAKNGNACITAIAESCKEIFDEHTFIDRYATIGKWKVNTPFMVINFSMTQEIENNSSSLQKMNQFIRQEIKDYFSDETYKSMLLVCNFMSQQAGEKELKNYIITNAYKKALEKYFSTAIYGILYSSAMTENNGLNVALSKKVVDDGIIEFEGACVYAIRFHPFKKSRTLFPCTDYVKKDCYGNFKLAFNKDNFLFN